MGNYAFQDILAHTLEANGVSGVSDLEDYIKDDIDRYGSRLRDLLRKLESARRDQLEGNERKAFGDEELFAQDGEAMVLSVHILFLRTSWVSTEFRTMFIVGISLASLGKTFSACASSA
jgi:hypothetical protein